MFWNMDSPDSALENIFPQPPPLVFCAKAYRRRSAGPEAGSVPASGRMGRTLRLMALAQHHTRGDSLVSSPIPQMAAPDLRRCGGPVPHYRYPVSYTHLFASSAFNCPSFCDILSQASVICCTATAILNESSLFPGVETIGCPNSLENSR